jgi:hypothetical protein
MNAAANHDGTVNMGFVMAIAPICQVLHPCPYQVYIIGGHFNNTSGSTTKATPSIDTTRIGQSPEVGAATTRMNNTFTVTGTSNYLH